jgi:DNA-binding protein HU-beta
MRKLDLIQQVSDETGLHKVDVIVLFESLLKTIVSEMSKGNNIYIRGFGSFIVKTRKAKVGQDILNKCQINIPERDVPVFKPSPEFQASMDKWAERRKQIVPLVKESAE